MSCLQELGCLSNGAKGCDWNLHLAEVVRVLVCMGSLSAVVGNHIFFHGCLQGSRSRGQELGVDPRVAKATL